MMVVKKNELLMLDASYVNEDKANGFSIVICSGNEMREFDSVRSLLLSYGVSHAVIRLIGSNKVYGVRFTTTIGAYDAYLYAINQQMLDSVLRVASKGCLTLGAFSNITSYFRYLDSDVEDVANEHQAV